MHGIYVNLINLCEPDKVLQLCCTATRSHADEMLKSQIIFSVVQVTDYKEGLS